MIIGNVVIEDGFMFDTVRAIAEESGVTDINVIASVYEELYNKTTAQHKSWNCKMIDEILLLRQND